ncbi:MAG: hypothetical protein ABII88_02965 [Candidatus Omnitrophota bacterium]
MGFWNKLFGTNTNKELKQSAQKKEIKTENTLPPQKTNSTPSFSLTIESIMPQGDSMMVAGLLEGMVPDKGSRVQIIGLEQKGTAIIQESITMGQALANAARAGAQIVASKSGSPLTRVAFVLNDIKGNGIQKGDKICST